MDGLTPDPDWEIQTPDVCAVAFEPTENPIKFTHGWAYKIAERDGKIHFFA